DNKIFTNKLPLFFLKERLNPKTSKLFHETDIVFVRKPRRNAFRHHQANTINRLQVIDCCFHERLQALELIHEIDSGLGTDVPNSQTIYEPLKCWLPFFCNRID